jgi:hypothetical protein
MKIVENHVKFRECRKLEQKLRIGVTHAHYVGTLSGEGRFGGLEREPPG